MITKLWVRWKIKNFQTALNNVNLEIEDVTDLVRWQRSFNAFLSQLYPQGSDLTISASRVISYDIIQGSKPLTPLPYKESCYNKFQKILTELRQTIREQGLPTGIKPPASKQIIDNVAVAILSILLTFLLTCYFTSKEEVENSIKSEQVLRSQAEIAASDFVRLITNMDNHFREKSLDSALHSLSDRYGTESGVYIQKVIEFAEDTRREKNNFIDSSEVRLKQLGVDIDTLDYSRKLPVRIGKLLKPRLEALRLDQGDMNAILLCDTL